MLKLSKLTDYAVVILSAMSKDHTHVYAALELSTITGITLPTVSKILKLLLANKIVVSTRGAKGGYMLAREPAKTSVAEVITAMDGPIALTECSLEHNACEQPTGCELRGNWTLINLAIQRALESVSLADMVRPVPRPEEIRIPIASLYR